MITGLRVFSSAAATYSQYEKKKKQLPQGAAILWREPVNIDSRDLLLGQGGERMKPDLSRLTFIKEEKGGYSKKYRVKDAKGRVCVAKLGKEAQSETAAVRLVWAVGYASEINYLVPRVTVEGKGTFENARFEARPENVERFDEWTWTKNPFAGKARVAAIESADGANGKLGSERSKQSHPGCP